MAERNEIQNTLGGTQFGSSLKDLSDGDLSRGYFDANPDGVEAGWYPRPHDRYPLVDVYDESETSMIGARGDYWDQRHFRKSEKASRISFGGDADGSVSTS